MQRSTSSTPIQGTIPFFSTNIWGVASSSKTDLNSQTSAQGGSSGGNSRSRPGTSSGDQSKDHSRRPSFGRKASFSSPSKSKRRGSSSVSNGGGGGEQIITDATVPPALPDYALSAAAKITKEPDNIVSPTSVDSFSKMLSRTMSTPSNGLYQTMSGVSGTTINNATTTSPQSVAPTLAPETPSLYSHMQDLMNKRISTLDYLRKA